MEWKEFGIEEVARLCGIQMKNDGMGAREIKALCPFCSDKHYHLYLPDHCDAPSVPSHHSKEYFHHTDISVKKLWML